MYVMGTAGHVDHGKSTLVTALSGIDPDRLPEEKARGMTIDLGFAWMTTNSGETIGIVDVPGHERFVKNMIAGVGAIDFVLLVIAADDGWMPQTSEHLAILRFLNVRRGIVVITKRDLVEPDWLDLVAADAAQKVEGVFPDSEPTAVVAVDSVSGHGLDELRGAIDTIARSLPPRTDIGRPRLYIDRVFQMTGRGVVVTGTLIDGALSAGRNVKIAPGGVSARIRELQIHKKTVSEARPGQRLAVNLAGVEGSALSRGQCIVAPDDDETVDHLWTHVSILPDATHPLTRRRRVLVMLGTAEPEALAYPLDGDQIAPGGEGFCELRLENPVKARLLDRFVLRWPTPQVTIGGGEILDVGGSPRLRRDPRLVERLERRRSGTLPVLRQTGLEKDGFASLTGFLNHAPFSRTAIDGDLQNASVHGEVTVSEGWSFDPNWLTHRVPQLLAVLTELHRDHPYLPGLNLSEWGERAHLSAAIMPAVAAWLLKQRQVERNGDAHQLPGHRPLLPVAWQDEADRLWGKLSAAGLQPPTRDELEGSGGHARAIVGFWIATERVVALGDGVILPATLFDEVRQKVRRALTQQPSLTAGQLRDLLGTTRKYAVPIGEALDREGLTRREGDVRVLA